MNGPMADTYSTMGLSISATALIVGSIVVLVLLGQYYFKRNAAITAVRFKQLFNWCLAALIIGSGLQTFAFYIRGDYNLQMAMHALSTIMFIRVARKEFLKASDPSIPETPQQRIQKDRTGQADDDDQWTPTIPEPI